MAIPQEVYSNVYYGDGNQVGAKMVDGDKSYFLAKDFDRNGRRYVTATVEVEIDEADRKRYERDGYSTLRHRPVAYKRIAPSSVPQSSSEDWECWNEY